MRSTCFAFAALVVFFFASRAVGDATLRVCNGTYDPVTVALAVVEPSTGGMQSESEGWFQIDARQCTLVIDTDLDPTNQYYLYAKATLETWAGDSNGGTRDAPFCTNFAGRFDYVDRSRNVCTGAGQQMLWFINEPINGVNWTVNLNDP